MTGTTEIRPPEPATDVFYVEVLAALRDARVPFLVGGACALEHYTGLYRNTKDLDLFLQRRDLEAAFDALHEIGCHTEITFPHWLGKALRDGDLVDLIFSSGNGVAAVDDEWFANATPGRVLGRKAFFCPVEEMIWSKAFIMERERFDGADVAHLLRARASDISWDRLLRRFGGRHWPVLLAHLLLFGFIYPGERDRIPRAVMRELLGRVARSEGEPAGEAGLCRGTLLSRAQYLVDIEEWGLRDARLENESSMTTPDVKLWTDCIAEEVRPTLTRPRS
jgi:hypothetical protein